MIVDPAKIIKGLFGCGGSVPFVHTNDRFLPFQKGVNGTAVWHNIATVPFHTGGK